MYLWAMEVVKEINGVIIITKYEPLFEEAMNVKDIVPKCSRCGKPNCKCKIKWKHRFIRL